MLVRGPPVPVRFSLWLPALSRSDRAWFAPSTVQHAATPQPPPAFLYISPQTLPAGPHRSALSRAPDAQPPPDLTEAARSWSVPRGPVPARRSDSVPLPPLPL